MEPVSTLKPLALYVHWPFCRKKCPYCDFNSHVRDGVDHAAWRDALLREMGCWHARMAGSGHQLSSIFFGGGTPSLMQPETVAAIIEKARTLWPASPDIEITLEANPTSVEAANFAALAQAGVNRVSLGVQSLRAESLAFLGREHSAHEALDAVALAAKHFPRYSFDLIYALPGQSEQAWEAELREALQHARGHLSLYQLTIEPNTAFHHQYHVQKAFALPADDNAAALYARTQAVMQEAGMPAYEVSNHAAAGQESRHNLSYWRSECYLGIGPGAHGRVDLGAQRYATHTLKSPERWLESVQRMGHGLEEETLLSAEERSEEYVLMGLRLPREGIDLNRVDATTRASMQQALPMLQQEGLVQCSNSLLQVTPKGVPVLNAVIGSLLRS
ncbi:MAG: coproporphyrinogen III oxidase [Azospirillum brasilense]|nr:MAG: coproporphyrinogen III oxidase [Azospirillum brasilense]